jgi:LysM repeat protein
MSYTKMRMTVAVAALVLPLASSPAQTLKGSHASVELMYTAAHSHDLAFLKTRDDVYAAAMSGALEMISITEDLTLNKVAYPFVLPYTHRFADSLAAAYHAGCGERLEVTSGSRPIDEQPRNASPESVHPTGMAVDFHKPGGACLTWLRTNLLALENRGVIEATEEKHPAHFHVAVLTQLREPPIKLVSSSSPATKQSATTTSGKVSTAAGDVALAPGTSTPQTYRVRAGDNLWTIAERHNTTTDQLKKLNNLRTTRLKVGQELKIR